MPSIGSFDAAVRQALPNEEPLTFQYGGKEFTLASSIPGLPMMRWQSLVAKGDDVTDAEADAAMWNLIRGCLKDDAEFARFENAALRESGRDIFVMLGKMIAGITSFPTSRSSGSSDGPSTTGKNSSEKLETVDLPESVQSEPDNAE